jgi:hypothetical protein
MQDTNLQSRTFENHAQLFYDVSGNINKAVLIQDLESPTAYKNTFSVMYEEVRVDKLVVTFYPGSDHIYGLHDMDATRMTPYHRSLPTSMTNDKASSIQTTRTFSPVAKRCRMEWNRIPDSPVECTFYPAQGDILTHYLPLSLGGVYIYMDGPVAFASSYAGSLFTKWHVTFRGVRSDDNNVAPLFPLFIPISPSRDSLSDVVVLEGKQYVRVGEATNPGPEESDDSDGDDDLITPFAFSPLI